MNRFRWGRNRSDAMTCRRGRAEYLGNRGEGSDPVGITEICGIGAARSMPSVRSARESDRPVLAGTMRGSLRSMASTKAAMIATGIGANIAIMVDGDDPRKILTLLSGALFGKARMSGFRRNKPLVRSYDLVIERQLAKRPDAGSPAIRCDTRVAEQMTCEL
mgnify:CR=1 FL=1